MDRSFLIDRDISYVELFIEDERLLKKPEVQKLLGVSRSTLGRWIKAGKFVQPCFKQNNRSFWQFKAIKSWLDAKQGK